MELSITNPIVLAAVTVGGSGLVCGALLAIASKFFAVKEDPRIEKAQDLLPGANCGGCGFAGCADYAKAVVVENAEINLCTPGGNAVLKSLAKLLNKDATAANRKVALVACNGSDEHAQRKFLYNGIADCFAAHATGGGDKKCPYGCLGYGSCARVCPTGAIEITDGRLAIVHPELCISCGACVKTCPRHLITLIPETATIHVLCSSKDKGPVVKKYCKVGCIGCTLCTKQVENKEISMDGTLATVDYTKPFDGSKAIEKCPMNTIVERRMTSAREELGQLELAE